MSVELQHKRNIREVTDVPPESRFSAWADLINDTYYPIDLRPLTDSFRQGKLTVFDVSDIRVAHVESDAMLNERCRTHTAAQSSDYYFVPLPIDHALTVEQNKSGQVNLSPGDFSIISTFQPYSYIQATRNRLHTLRIPGSLLRNRLPVADDVLGLHFSQSSPVVRLFVDMVRSFAHNGPDLEASAAGRLTDHLIDLLALSLEAPDGALQSSESSVRAAHRARAFNLIEQRLADPMLCPSEISKELRISMRYLQKLFAERDQTLTALIRQRRISAACRMLRDPSRTAQSVSAIGYAVGYADAAYFSRVFKQQTGHSPTECRQAS